MLSGRINSRLEAIFPLGVRDSAGCTHMIEVLLDTGFNGALTLRPSTVAVLGLPLRHRERLMLADGTIQSFDVHTATVEWDGIPLQILVHAIDNNPLLGTRLLIGYEINIRYTLDGEAIIRQPI